MNWARPQRVDRGPVAWRRALTFSGDGLFDIFLGLAVVDAGAILDGRTGAGAGEVVIVLLPVLLLAKRRLTAPRLSSGYEPRRSRLRPYGLLALSGALALPILGLALVLIRAGPGPGAPDGLFWALGALAVPSLLIAVAAVVPASAEQRLRIEEVSFEPVDPSVFLAPEAIRGLTRPSEGNTLTGSPDGLDLRGVAVQRGTRSDDLSHARTGAARGRQLLQEAPVLRLL